MAQADPSSIEIPSIRINQSPAILKIRIFFWTLLCFFIVVLLSLLFRSLEAIMGNQVFSLIPADYFFLTGILLIYAIGIFFIVAQWESIHYEIYNNRIILKSGIFSSKDQAIELSEFGSATATSDALGKMFHYGNLKFDYRLLHAQKTSEYFLNIPNSDYYLSIIINLLTPRKDPTLLYRSA